MGITPILGIYTIIRLMQPENVYQETTKTSTFLNMSFFVHLDSQ